MAKINNIFMPHVLLCQHKLTQKNEVRLIFRIKIIFFIYFILLCFLGNQTGVKNPELKAQLPSSFAIIFLATKNEKQL